MCQMLLSINPKYVKMILSGEKKYEYRKFLCREDVNKIIIYETSPVKRIVAEAEIEKIIIDDVSKVWDRTKEYSGIDKDFYEIYYRGKKKAFAYQLKNVVSYEQPKLLADVGVKFAPQSYCYLS